MKARHVNSDKNSFFSPICSELVFRSEERLAGLVVSPVAGRGVEEGGPPGLLALTATVPVLCSPQDRVTGDCCVTLELGLSELGQPGRCPTGGQLQRVSIARQYFGISTSFPTHGSRSPVC